VTRGKSIVTGTLAAVVVVILLAWLLWPSTGEPPPREREYRAFTACLLTGEDGLLGEEARAAWAGMQRVSVDQRVKVQYLAVSGEQNVTNALPYFNGLATQSCAVIVAAGDPAVAAMMRGKGRFPQIRYVAVGAGGDASVTTVDTRSADAITSGVASIVSKAAAGTD
jgi:hypothetical protein